MHHAPRNTFVAAAAAAFALAAAPAAAQSWTPERAIEITVGSGAGSGTDRTARVAQKILQDHKMIPVPVTVVNRPGGGSAIGFTHLHSRAGDAHHFNLGSFNLITNHITGRSKLSYTDFTPLAHLFDEFVSFSVREGSPITDGRVMIERLRADPASVSFGISSSVAGANHIALALAMKAAGIEVTKVRTVVFNSGGESITAVLGGHVDVVVVGAASVARLKEGKRVRPLAVGAPRRLGGPLASVPTWKEQGIDMVASNWRNAIGPGGITPAQVAWWDGVFARMTKTPEWQKYLEQNFSDSDAYLNSATTTRFIAEEYNTIRAILVELGLAKQ